MSSSNIQYMIISDDLDVNEGSIMENMFATQLVSNGYKSINYDKKKFGELDFVIESENKLQPIEIKSGNNYKKHPALNHVIEMKDDQMKKPIVFCIGNIEETEDLIYIPLYMVMFLTEPCFVKQIDFTLHI